MSRFNNTDPFAAWNDPMRKDDPFMPHNNPMRRDNPFEPWNNPCTSNKDLSEEDKKAYGIRKSIFDRDY
jgi:hypothetical protein